jgi:hypothetical protein
MNKVKLSRIKHWPGKNTHQNQKNQQVKHYQRHKSFITASVGVESNKNCLVPKKISMAEDLTKSFLEQQDILLLGEL